MEGDPFSQFHRMLGGKIEAGRQTIVRQGLVLSAEPLSIKAGGLPIPLDGSCVWVNESLVREHRQKLALEELSGSLEGQGSCSDGGTVSGFSVTGGTVETQARLIEPLLRAGDQVVLLSEDDQQFYLICKVVRVP